VNVRVNSTRDAVYTRKHLLSPFNKTGFAILEYTYTFMGKCITYTRGHSSPQSRRCRWRRHRQPLPAALSLRRLHRCLLHRPGPRRCG
jgi:hypothetical protein